MNKKNRKGFNIAMISLAIITIIFCNQEWRIASPIIILIVMWFVNTLTDATQYPDNI